MNLPKTSPSTKNEKAANIIMLVICGAILAAFVAFVVVVVSNTPMHDCTINQ